MTEVFTAQLQRRNARSGSLPLITYYDETRHERIELSGISFANWVDKTAGLLTDEVMVEPGDRVRLTLARTHPAHWVTLVWIVAAWRARCVVNLDADADAAVEVIGPQQVGPGDTETIACSLHPFGLGFSAPLPAGVLDYGVEVRSHPDVFSGPHPDPNEPAWIDADLTRTHAEVVSGPVGDSVRALATPVADESVWSVAQRSLIRPVNTGGSAVIVVGADADRLAAISAAEKAV